MKKYIVTAGGTGGHIYPALTIADELSKDGEVIFIASKNGIDKEIIDKYNVDYKVLYWNLRGFSRKKNLKSIINNIINIFKLLILMMKSYFLIKRFNPNTVIGFGGYITFPIVYMASKVKKKTVIHEQNSFPGVTNRQLSKVVDTVAYTYESSKKYFPASKLLYTSNPRAYKAKEYSSENEIITYSKAKKNILVLGGSLGAQKINHEVLKISKELSNAVFHLVVGERYYEEMKSNESENLKIYPYLNDIFNYMKQSDLVITRAGASTLLELIWMKKKIIAIPSPNVVADHQTTNAIEFEKKNYLTMIKEDKLTKELLLKKILEELETNKIIQQIEVNPINEIVKIIKG